METLKQQHTQELSNIESTLFRLTERRKELLAILATIEAVEKEATPTSDTPVSD